MGGCLQRGAINEVECLLHFVRSKSNRQNAQFLNECEMNALNVAQNERV